MSGLVERLRECPFCGATGDLSLNGALTAICDKDGRNPRIKCDNCTVVGPPGNSVEDAVEQWNLRASDPLIEQLVEALAWYAEQLCEFGKSNEGCGKFSADVCAGCKARATLSAARGGSNG